MPISREEFERGQIDLKRYVLDVLTEEPDLAWSFEELHDEVESRIGTLIPQDAFGPALASLEVGGRIQSREVWGLAYYILKQPGEDKPSV